jgi:hypothetical protein
LDQTATGLVAGGTPLEGVGIMNGFRTGSDAVLGWSGFQTALQATMQYCYLHNIAWYCDPDMLLVRPPLTLGEARAWAALEGLTGQALMSSDRLMDLPEDRVELLRRVFPGYRHSTARPFPQQTGEAHLGFESQRSGPSIRHGRHY